MTSSSYSSSGEGMNGFKENLKFFQNQVDKSNLLYPPSEIKKRSRTQHSLLNDFKETATHTKASSSAPSVDNILLKVKSLCSTTDGKFSSTDAFGKCEENRQSHNVIGKLESYQCQEQVTKCDQTSTPTPVVTPTQQAKPDSLLNKFDPCLGFNEKPVSSHKVTSSTSVKHSPSKSVPSNTVKSTMSNTSNSIGSSLSTTCHKQYSESILKSASIVNNVNAIKVSSVKELPEDINASATSKTFGQCKERFQVDTLKSKDRLQTAVESNSVKKVAPSNNTCVDESKQSTCRIDKSSNEGIKQVSSKVDKAVTSDLRQPLHESKSKDEKICNGESKLTIPQTRKSCNGECSDSNEVDETCESDFESHEFVVHKVDIPDDYLETVSEDNYSSFAEDYEVEQADSRTSSPLSDSEEEEYIVQHTGPVQFGNMQFVNSNASDNRHYVYYVDDKELEVIPEEDEDDLEDYEMFDEKSHFMRDSFRHYRDNSDDSRSRGDCDSGLTDDQKSSSTTNDDFDPLDDSDSAQGSQRDESPPLRQEPSPNGEKRHKKSSLFRRKVEDYDRPKLKGKSVEVPIQEDVEDEGFVSRCTTGSWDPRTLLEVLYRLDFSMEKSKKNTQFINKEGHLEKLPSGRKKATYWNPWKTKYIRLKDGFLFCHDNIRSEKPSMVLQLMGGRIDNLDNQMLGIDDMKGHYVVVRCPNEGDIHSWETALRSQCIEDFQNAYTSPSLYPLPINKNVIVIDLGSCSVRAGILMSSPSLPKLFFPTICAKGKTSHKSVFGFNALCPYVRKESKLSFPLNHTPHVTKYSIDVSILPDLLKHVFSELNISPENYKIQLSMPQNLTLQTKIKIAKMLLDDFRVKGVNLTHQAILSLHAYNSKSGIIVDIGNRLDVIPIIEGYIVESGVTRLPYGGQRMLHHLKHALAGKNISLVSDVETYLTRYILEQLCYVAEDYTEELQRYHTNPDDFEMSISAGHFFEDDCPWKEIGLDVGRFHVPEGLFDPETWGLDNPGLHKVVHHAIQECGVDLRREMTRSIYLSGGLTLLPGFVDRLEGEIDKLTPDTITPKVHASPYRYHMSYIGACQIALEEKFDEICITKDMWRKEGNTCVKKWHI